MSETLRPSVCFYRPSYGAPVATAVEPLVLTLRLLASKEYSNVTNGGEEADLPNDYDSMRFEREVELGQVGVPDLALFEPILHRALCFKRFLKRVRSLDKLENRSLPSDAVLSPELSRHHGKF
jgi:hypothetical protein